jgi:uncharacterized damage-inducible protein DinB
MKKNLQLVQIQDLYRYNRWANVRILDAATNLSNEDFMRDLKNSYPSIRDTLAHVMSAEWAWLERCRGSSPKQMLPSSSFPTVSALRERWDEIHRGLLELLNSITGETLNTIISYVNFQGETWKYPLWQILYHVVNHSTYHRGQIITMFRRLGSEPMSTDLLLYYDMEQKSAAQGFG